MSENIPLSDFIMINLVFGSKSKVSFELNKSNIVSQHLTIDKDILLLGGVELAVANLLIEAEEEVKTIKSQMDNQALALQELKSQTRRQLQMIEEKSMEVLKKESEIVVKKLS